ncbi:MAG: pyruvate dehydrogenase (acetyl-transferring), homodimeric type [Acidobacteriaceae bacterium]|nr:pyruvate dehydrogenase (acetyl-transferring), homodimeric type [Acidobacteriaceae bacterium]MBV9780576.1 pyruvate dehydrogenase (acetyl-transferring), homodimeric type [Acidobacteriaceae bacterium]
MLRTKEERPKDLDPQETSEWLEALDQIVDEAGPDRAAYLIEKLLERAAEFGVSAPQLVNTPFINTIPVHEEVPFPGNGDIERRIKSLIRWNASAMVVRANKYDPNIGGHISTYASLATLSEVGFNHFFRATIDGQPGDLIYYQGHASPGVYARAFLEGRLTEQDLQNFRHELRETPGLSSYPHPWLMPRFWQFPTVSMGLGPINAIYNARFLRYLENREILPKTDRKLWAFLGDGEMDEPESTGALHVAVREKLDNLIFVINCNLQRLDGPVRGNGSIIRELEGVFRGAGWNVIKLIWGRDWDELLRRDTSGLLMKRMGECVDGEYQNFKARGGAYTRKEFFGKYPELLKLVEDKTDEQIARFRRGGHDPVKVYNAYKRAAEHQGQPTVILAMSVKGYGLGEAGEGKNITHQQKKLNEEELVYLSKRFDLNLPDETIHSISFVRPPDDSPEIKYLKERREKLGGYLPARAPKRIELKAPPLDAFKDVLAGSRGREASTTSAFVAILKTLLKNPDLGKYVVPIIPDEARTFGMESMFRERGIYASGGQLYKPVDSEVLMYYKEAKDGQILEEGITEAGSMASFTAAGTAYANVGVPAIPFFIYYSMFGFQRMGDLVWAFADARGKGFLVGGTAGRTTLLGEGLQHEDGHSHVLFSVVPTCISYDPAFAYEIAVIIQDGIRRMYENNEDRFYYLTVGNENYAQPAMPESDGVREGILRGLYLYKASETGLAQVTLFGSGSILNEALKAQKLLSEKYGIGANVWSVTSYNELRREALAVERWNRLHPGEPERKPYLLQALGNIEMPVIAATDYMKVVADQISPWLPGRLTSLGTDGFGRSDNREHLRKFFEVDSTSIAAAALSRLAHWGRYDANRARDAIQELGINPETLDPAIS